MIINWAFDPDVALMKADDLFADCQTETCSFATFRLSGSNLLISIQHG